MFQSKRILFEFNKNIIVTKLTKLFQMKNKSLNNFFLFEQEKKLFEPKRINYMH